MCKHDVCVSEFKKKSIIFCMSTYISATLTYTCARFLCNFHIHCLSVYKNVCECCLVLPHSCCSWKLWKVYSLLSSTLSLTIHKFFCEMYLTYIEIYMHEYMLRIQLKTISITSVTQYHTKKLFMMRYWIYERLQHCVCCRRYYGCGVALSYKVWVKRYDIKSRKPDIQST